MLHLRLLDARGRQLLWAWSTPLLVIAQKIKKDHPPWPKNIFFTRAACVEKTAGLPGNTSHSLVNVNKHLQSSETPVSKKDYVRFLLYFFAYLFLINEDKLQCKLLSEYLNVSFIAFAITVYVSNYNHLLQANRSNNVNASDLNIIVESSTTSCVVGTKIYIPIKRIRQILWMVQQWSGFL